MFSFFRKIRNKNHESDQGPVNLGTLKSSSSSKVTVKSESKVSKDYKKVPCTKSGTESDVTLLAAEVYPCPSIVPVCAAEKDSTEIVSVNPESTVGGIHKDDPAHEESPDEFCEALETIPTPPTNYEILGLNSEYLDSTFLEGANNDVVNAKNPVKPIDTDSLDGCTVQSMPTDEYKKMQEDAAKFPNLSRDVSPPSQLSYPSIHNR